MRTHKGCGYIYTFDFATFSEVSFSESLDFLFPILKIYHITQDSKWLDSTGYY